MRENDKHVNPESMQSGDAFLVSAVVSVYKSKKYIMACLEDLINQTLFKKGGLEIVLINSNSPEDEEPDILEYQSKFPHQIQYQKTEERETVYGAWNRGIRMARGKYITNANTDDRHRENALEKLALLLEKNPDAALAYADCDVTAVENGTFGQAPVHAKFLWPDFDPVLLFKVCYVGPQPMWRKKLHDVYGYFDSNFKSAGDYDFWLRLAVKENFIHLKESLGLYLEVPTSIEHANQSSSVIESELARKRNWPAAWGQRPNPEGSFLFPVESPVTLEKPKLESAPEKNNTLLHRANGASQTDKNDARDERPLVSVVIPTYNRPERLAKCLESVAGQTYQSYEIIVINDGGESVEAVIESSSIRDKIVSVRHPHNRERSAARNSGLGIAKGKYIAYLDDDDVYYPNHLETLVGFLENNKVAVAYSDAARVHEEKMGEKYQETGRDVPYSRDFDNDLILINNFIPTLCFMHLKSCLDEVGTFDESLETHEDWDLWIRLSRKFQLHHIKKVTCQFSSRNDGSSTTSSKHRSFHDTREEIYRKYAALVENRPDIRKKQEEFLADSRQDTTVKELRDQAFTFLSKGDFSRALECFKGILEINPNDPESFIGLGELSKHMGNLEDSLVFFEKAVSLVGDQPILRKKITQLRAKVSSGMGETVPGQQSKSNGETLRPVVAAAEKQHKANPDVLEPIFAAVKSRDIPSLMDACLSLENSPTLLNALLEDPRARSQWRELFGIAKEGARIGCYYTAKTISEQILQWEPEYWFARELPRQFEGYYSQMDQDRLIERFFLKRGSRTRRFVEVGAFDGVHYSNVRRLHEKYGWSGICIEPVRKNFQRLLDSYAGTSVKCVRAAASDKVGKAKINVSTYPHLPEWGTDVASLDQKETSRWDKYQAVWTEEEVEVLTINHILEEKNTKGFDFISIDAEGHDLEVLKGIDFDLHQPALVVVEYGEYREDIFHYMKSQGYALYHDNGQDLFLERPLRSIPAKLEEVEGALHPHLTELDYFAGHTLEQKQAGPCSLLHPGRFDLTAKLLYARHHISQYDTSFAEEIYREHLKVFNGFSEEEKQSFDDFKISFQNLLESVKAHGFNARESLVPVDSQGVIVDGAHRVAAGILLDKQIPVVETSRPSATYDYKWFLSRGLSQDAADAMACEYIRWSPHSLVVSLFPAAMRKEEEVEAILKANGAIAYHRDVKVSGNGPALLIWQMYRNEPWVGEPGNLWQGAQHKAAGCFPQGRGTVQAYVWEPKEGVDLKAVKEEIRSLYRVGNHSVHINDTHRESVLLGGLFFNPNSRHFLNRAKLSYLANFWRLFCRFQVGLASQQADVDLFSVDGSAILSAYGLRECRDLDFLHTGVDDLSFGDAGLIGSHNLCMGDHLTARDDILFNPGNHFYFHGIRFASLAVLQAMKEKRGEGKDLNDIALMDRLAPFPSLQVHPNPVKKPFDLHGRPIRIVGLVTARNESATIGQCLRALCKITDAIIILDDASTDNTLKVCEELRAECRIEHIIRKQVWFRDEPGDRNRLLNAGRSIGGTHFMVIDADECFTANLIEGDVLRKEILNLQMGDCLELQWLQLWRSTSQYRNDDSIWNHNYKPFVFRDNWDSYYTSEFIHTSRIPHGLNGRTLRLEGPAYGLMHFQFVNWDNLLLKQAWYRCLEKIRLPDKSVDEINQKYAPSKDEFNIRLSPVPENWFAAYGDFDHNCYQQPDNWRKEQIFSWFSQYGRDYFSGLDIWDIQWEEDESQNPLPGSTSKTNTRSESVTSLSKNGSFSQRALNKRTPPSEEILSMFPLSSVPGKPGYVSWNGINGFLTQQDVVVLYQRAYKQPPGATLVEVGSFFGLSSCVMARALIDSGNTTARLYCIDLWENYHGSSLEAFRANCARAGISDQIIAIKEDSTSASRKFKPQSVDLVFIDGNHSYEGASRDIANYWNLVRPGATLIGHDYAPDSQGVVKAVSEFCQEHRDWSFSQPVGGSSVFSLLSPKKMADVVSTPNTTRPKKILVYAGLHKGSSFDKIFKDYEICIGFEANPDLYRELAAKYGKFPHVHIFNAAVATENGNIDFHISSNDGASSSIGHFNPSWNMASSGKIQMAKSVTVPCVNLLEYLEAHGIHEVDDYISDIQGMDLEVLKTLEPWIRARKIKTIQCEVQKSEKPQIYGDLPSNSFEEFQSFLGEDYDLISTGWGELKDGQFNKVPEDWWEFDAKWTRKFDVSLE